MTVTFRAAKWLAALLAVAFCVPAMPQLPAAGEPEPAARRPIGLALSGGGARGGAHIGALRALEELRVPLDYIAGTSIGAAIGGFYAMGMDADEIEAFVDGIDWEAAFRNSTPRKLRSFRRKRDDDLFLVSQKPGLNRGEFELPSGVVQGQVIELILSRVTLPAWQVHDFERLAIPFRAVAGDIVTGEAVVLEQGNLARAIRASMAVPAVLSPIEIDGRLLVDGGIVMNLPVEVARSMGAETIIAIDITDSLAPREELRSVLDVTGQLTSLLTLRGTVAQRGYLDDRDILIQPAFEAEFSSVSFTRISETIGTGYDAVMAQRERLAPLALSPAAYEAYRAALADPRRDPPRLDFVAIDNQSIIADSVIVARLDDIVLGEPMDVDKVETAINRVHGLELYQNVRYALVEQDGRAGLEVELSERSWGPNYLQLGVAYSSSSDEDAVFGLAASYLRTAINDKGGEWRATFLVGDEPAFLMNLYQPLGPDALFFVSPSVDFESNLFNVFDGDQLAAELNLRQGTLELGAGRELPAWGEIRAGLRSGYGEARMHVGDPAFSVPESFRRGEWFTRFSVDTLDDVSFPRSGLLATAEWRGSRIGTLSADANFDQLLLSAAWAKSWGRHTVTSTLRYDSTISGTAPINALHRLGGFLDLSGLNSNQLSAQNVMRIGTSWYRRIGDLALFPAFAGVSLEVGNAWDSRADISLNGALVGGSLWAGVETPVGPIYVGYGLAEGGRNAFYVFLGRPF
jgi:NTE family protein